jgi:hypothetical protein
MMSKIRKHHSIFILSYILYILAGCQGINLVKPTLLPVVIPSYSPTGTMTPSLTPISSFGTIVLTPSPTSKTTYPSFWLTHLPTHTPPPHPKGFPPTWTPLPTYPPDKAVATVVSLYENNPCRLPCWWGIEPGKTDWRDAWQLLARFATNRSPWETLLTGGEILGHIKFEVYLDVPGQKFPYLDQLVFFINYPTPIVDYIFVNTGNIKAYKIPQLLATYGPPDEVYVVGNFGLVNSMQMYLNYSRLGITSIHRFNVDEEDILDNQVKVCDQEYSELFLWEPARRFTFTRIMGLDVYYVTEFTINDFRTLEQISDMDIDKFYTAFVGQEQTCLDLKTDAWYGIRR